MAQPARRREEAGKLYLPAIQSSASLQQTWDSAHRRMKEGAQVSANARLSNGLAIDKSV